MRLLTLISDFAKRCLCVWCFILIGCAETDSSVIRFALSTGAVTLDPRFATDATSNRLCRLIYRSPVDFNEAFEPVPALASWQWKNDSEIEFQIHRGQRFHDGSTVTAHDMVATYRSILDPRMASPHRGSLAVIENLEATDEFTVVFKLKRPEALFPGLLVIGVMPEKIALGKAVTAEKPVGSGAFRVNGSWNDKRVDLIRVADGKAFRFLTVRDPTVRALKMAHGEIDITQGSLAPEIVAWLERQANIGAVSSAGTTFTYLGINYKDEKLSDPKIRQAIAYAIDRESIIKYLFGGRARLASSIFAPEHWAVNRDLSPIPYDPEEAVRLLQQAGFDLERPLRLIYKTSSDHFRLRIATVIQDQLAKVGIELDIQSYDWGTFYGDIKAGRFQLYSLSWVGLKLPDIFRYVFHSDSIPPVGANRGRYRSEMVNRLIENAESESNIDDQKRLYRQIQENILQDLPYVPLWYEDHSIVMRDDVRGYSVGLDGNYDALSAVIKEVGK